MTRAVLDSACTPPSSPYPIKRAVQAIAIRSQHLIYRKIFDDSPCSHLSFKSELSSSSRHLARVGLCNEHDSDVKGPAC